MSRELLKTFDVHDVNVVLENKNDKIFGLHIARKDDFINLVRWFC